ncbi:MAG: hypothetical protein JNN15_02430, partial [Blastocatellia bacterium]|nr:hypothetical protein [Blastocatellia bacterium]
TSVSDVFAKQAGSNRAHTFTENIPRFAHAFAADNLINLADYTQKYEPKTEDLFLLLGTGLNTWAATVVKKV